MTLNRKRFEEKLKRKFCCAFKFKEVMWQTVACTSFKPDFTPAAMQYFSKSLSKQTELDPTPHLSSHNIIIPTEIRSVLNFV